MSAIIEYDHHLIGPNHRWADNWKEGDVHTCWHDGHDFDWMPVPLPVEFDETKKQYRVFGCFCSFSCAKAWQMERPCFNSPIARSWLSVMAKDIFRFPRNKIVPAHEAWVLLSKKMDIEEFRSTTDRCETLRPPLLPACMASVRGPTNKVLSSIYSTRNNETIDEGTSSRSAESKMSVYQRYLAEQHPITVERSFQAASVEPAAPDSSGGAAAKSTPSKRKAPASAESKRTHGKKTLASYIRKSKKK